MTTFVKEYGEIAEKQFQLLSYANPDRNEKTYRQGNEAFAQEQSAMYVQGIWAIPEIKKYNSSLELGVFPFPSSDDPSRNHLVSGVDTVLTISSTTSHPEEADRFIAYLTEESIIRRYIADQGVFPAFRNIDVSNPDLSGVMPDFRNGRMVDYADHFFPSSMDLETIVQQYLFTGNTDHYLKQLDQAWENAQRG
ncbi:ABC transporter substrate-binding protein [Cohnella algarum]|uniref:ABC transporter substrate-binding protein n=1 Tax=Cohnella algarum TaxID=2044859 RepID=UPI0019679364|nr:ABC transporter substrate-binding protein [Cohnella algarum]MBN2982334.1 extracellular solute-binding protein [Cohnella algarum]